RLLRRPPPWRHVPGRRTRSLHPGARRIRGGERQAHPPPAPAAGRARLPRRQPGAGALRGAAVVTAPRSDTPAGQRLLAEWKGKRPERHAGVSGEAQRRQRQPERPAPSVPEGTVACYVHTPTGTRGVSLDAALSLIRGGRVRSLDIHVDETL